MGSVERDRQQPPSVFPQLILAQTTSNTASQVRGPMHSVHQGSTRAQRTGCGSPGARGKARGHVRERHTPGSSKGRLVFSDISLFYGTSPPPPPPMPLHLAPRTLAHYAPRYIPRLGITYLAPRTCDADTGRASRTRNPGCPTPRSMERPFWRLLAFDFRTPEDTAVLLGDGQSSRGTSKMS